MSHKLASTCYYYHQQIRENQFFHARVLSFIFDVFFHYVLTTTNPKDTVTFICFNLQGIVAQKKNIDLLFITFMLTFMKYFCWRK